MAKRLSIGIPILVISSVFIKDMICCLDSIGYRLYR